MERSSPESGDGVEGSLSLLELLTQDEFLMDAKAMLRFWTAPSVMGFT